MGHSALRAGRERGPLFYREFYPELLPSIQSGLGAVPKGEAGWRRCCVGYPLFAQKYEDYGAVLSSGRLLKQIETGQPLGYFVVDIMESAFADKYDKAYRYDGGEVYLLDDKGYIISSRHSKLEVGTRLEKPYLDAVLQEKKGFFESRKIKRSIWSSTTPPICTASK